ncbi:MAG: family 16 glycosylhydrolase [Boseongicola sp.]|nr:family 16 glycosylhydrolase [Boseongicola sp.]
MAATTKHVLNTLQLATAVLFLCGCSEPPSSAESEDVSPGEPSEAGVYPASDPSNTGGWILREDISDEFDGSAIDKSKWFVQGDNGDYYIWKGRAPSQFAAHNVIVEDGLLKLRSQWEPDFDFAIGEGHEGNDYATHEGEFIPVTTAAIVSHKRFLNGYMEVRSRSADAAMTSSFWMIGYESELDVYETMGNPKMDSGSGITATMLKASVHDWQPPAQRPTRRFGYVQELPWRVADDFHVYGVDWGPDYLKFYIDGELTHEVTQAEVGRDWVLTNPLEIWLDSEIFVWLGLPHEEELPADFLVDYVRVWQKPETNLLDRAFFGFEGPILYQDQPRPLDLVPENSENNDYQKFWIIDETSSESLAVVRHETFSSGTRSLRYTGAAAASAVSPEASVSLPAGDLVFSARIFVEAGAAADSVRFELQESSSLAVSVDLSELPTGEWATVNHAFSRSGNDAATDELAIHFSSSGAPDDGMSVYVDDIRVEFGDSSG